MQILFEGEQHQIEANTLINYLIHYNAIVSEANNVYGQGDKKITVKVNAMEKGSFVVDLSLYEESVVSLFSKDSVEYLAAVVTVVGGVWGVYKLLKGRPVRSKEDEETIETVFNNVNSNNRLTINQTIINVYNKKTVREAISQAIQTADDDENVSGVSISDEHDQTVRFDRSEFMELRYTDFDIEDRLPENIQEVVEARLTIISLNFERGNRWQFMYNGFKISMVVKDDALMERIDSGDRFGKGDSIRVRMLITKQYNPAYRAYENKSYRIVEFIEHILSPIQGSLFG